MKVIMLADVKKVGKKGETIEVSDGFANNFLFPRKFAVPSNESTQISLAKANAAESARQEELKKQADAIADKLTHINVEFKAKAGKDGRMIGTISPKEIAEGLKEQWDISIDKRKFLDKYPANVFGYTRLKIELYKGEAGTVVGTVNVHISEDK